MNLKRLLVKHKGKVVILLVLILLAAAADIYAGYMLTLFYDIVISPDIKTAVLFSAYIVILWVAAVTMAYFAERYKAILLEILNNDLKDEMIDGLSRMEYEKYVMKEPGEYSSWLTNDINQIEAKCIIPFFDICKSFSTVVFSVIALRYMHPVILGICVISTIILYFIPKFFEKSIERSMLTISALNEKFSQKVYNTISGFPAFIATNSRYAFTLQNKEISRHLEAEKKMLTQKIAKLEMFSTSVFRILEQSICCVTAILAFMNIVGVGIVFSIGNISNRFLNGINSFFASLVMLRSSSKLFKKYEAQIVEGEMETCPGIKNEINIQDLTIVYGEHTVIKNKNFVFEIGKKYAVVGESGSGKSSLMKAIVGFNNNYGGKILFDATDRKKYSSDSILKQIAYINQDPIIFNDTIWFNLTLGKKDFQEEEIQNAVKLVNLEQFVNSQEKGLNTLLNDGGKNISGGQKQRMVIARFLLLKKYIFIVDEGTSALDSGNMQAIEELLLNNPNYTTILITHNMSERARGYFSRIYNLDR